MVDGNEGKVIDPATDSRLRRSWARPTSDTAAESCMLSSYERRKLMPDIPEWMEIKLEASHSTVYKGNLILIEPRQTKPTGDWVAEVRIVGITGEDPTLFHHKNRSYPTSHEATSTAIEFAKNHIDSKTEGI